MGLGLRRRSAPARRSATLQVRGPSHSPTLRWRNELLATRDGEVDSKGGTGAKGGFNGGTRGLVAVAAQLAPASVVPQMTVVAAVAQAALEAAEASERWLPQARESSTPGGGDVE
jgi:hypothetical protein